MEKGKGAQSFFKTIDAYAKDGWDVILVNPNYKIGETPEINGVVNYNFKPFFFPLTKVKKISFLGRILHSLHGNYILYKIAKNIIEESQGNSCVYAYEVHGARAAKKLANKFGLPLVTRFQGTVLHPIKDNCINRLKKYPHFNALSTNADITIMTDDGTHGDKVLKRLGNQSNTIKFWRNGVDINRSNEVNIDNISEIRKKCDIRENDKVLLTVSRLASWKRLDRSINAMEKLVDIDRNIKLVIVGDGDEKENLMKLAKKLSVTDNVCFIGAVEQSEIKDYMEIADIFLSLYDLSNVGNPLLEAMSCGKPIITLNVGDTSSLIMNNQNGVLLDVNNLDLLPTEIIKILEDQNYAKTLGENAKAYAEREFWSWDERMEAELNIVNKLHQEYYGVNND